MLNCTFHFSSSSLDLQPHISLQTCFRYLLIRMFLFLSLNCILVVAISFFLLWTSAKSVIFSDFVRFGSITIVCSQSSGEKWKNNINFLMFHRKKVSPDSKTEKPILQSTEKQIKGFILIIRFSSYRWLPHSWFKSYVFHIVFWPCELIFSANKTFVADEILTCQTVKCSENTYLGSTYVIFSVLNGQLKNKWLQTKTVTLTFSANWIVRG